MALHKIKSMVCTKQHQRIQLHDQSPVCVLVTKTTTTFSQLTLHGMVK